jgi:hypothetical protein
MPMLDACIPEGALSPEAKDTLLARLTGLLLRHEGVDPAIRRAGSGVGLRAPPHGLRRRRGSSRAATDSCARSQKASTTTNGARPSPPR